MNKHFCLGKLLLPLPWRSVVLRDKLAALPKFQTSHLAFPMPNCCRLTWLFLGTKVPRGAMCASPQGGGPSANLCRKALSFFYCLLLGLCLMSCAWCPARARDKLGAGGSCQVHMVFMI